MQADVVSVIGRSPIKPSGVVWVEFVKEKEEFGSKEEEFGNKEEGEHLSK